MKNLIFSGVGTALITPFNKGKVDYIALMQLIERQIKLGIDALIILGTTGEPATLSMLERKKIINLAVELCRGKTKVIVGCGANSTAKAKELYLQAQNLGADGALIVTPYYNKCTQSGLIEHYKTISECGDLPIVIYNVPSRTGVNIQPQTVVELAKIKNIVGIKEASGNINQVIEIKRLVGDDFAIYCGEDALNTIFASLGCDGEISVLSNVVPDLSKKIWTLCQNSNYKEANKLQLSLIPLINALFCEVNPIPTKFALNYLGLCKNELRLPLTKLEENNQNLLKNEIINVWAKYYDSL